MLAVAARMGFVRVGAIELLFSFAPLVIVPLGIEVGLNIRNAGRFDAAFRRFQPLGTALAVLAKQ